MLEVQEMLVEEQEALLRRIRFGHLGCVQEDGRPYVVPMHYTYDPPGLYFFTTEGMKTRCIAANAAVCFQVEEIHDPSNWQSVLVAGRAEQLTRSDEMEHAMQLITGQNPALTPAINKSQAGSAISAEREVALYRLHVTSISGRKTGTH